MGATGFPVISCLNYLISFFLDWCQARTNMCRGGQYEFNSQYFYISLVFFYIPLNCVCGQMYIVCMSETTDLHTWRSVLKLNDSINSLVSKRYPCNFKWGILNHFKWLIHILNISCKIAFRWKPWDLIVEGCILAQVMVDCHLATNH